MMPIIYEPSNIIDVPEDDMDIIHVDLLPGKLKVHFHESGVVFVATGNCGAVLPVSYEVARGMLVAAIDEMRRGVTQSHNHRKEFTH
jgi:hypothetical protein